MNYFIGIDVGTSGTKAVLFDENGVISATAYREYELIQPHNGWAEQRAEDWAEAAVQTLAELAASTDPGQIKGIGVSGQMHGLVAVDKAGQALCNSIIWCDQRTNSEAEFIEKTIGRREYINSVLNAPAAAFTICKLLWVKTHLPEVYEKADKIMLPKDYVNYILTGKILTEVSDAGGTGCFDVKNRCWADDIIEKLGVKRSLFPRVAGSSEVVGCITEEIAKRTGLESRTVVVCGAGDQAAAALGNGIVGEGDMSVSLGTSGVVFSAVSKPIYDENGRIHTFCHAVPGLWHVMGVTQGCGLSVSWFRHNFAPEKSYDELNAAAYRTNSSGAMFLPYLMGERTPHFDSSCRGAFIGLSASQNVANLYRAVLEGVCFSLKDCCSVMNGIGLNAENIRVGGGGAGSELWLQILADVFGKAVSRCESAESGARGVAMLAAVGSGFYKSVNEANAAMNSADLRTFEPRKQESERYSELYEVYKALYPALKEQNDKLLSLNANH